MPWRGAAGLTWACQWKDQLRLTQQTYVPRCIHTNTYKHIHMHINLRIGYYCKWQAVWWEAIYLSEKCIEVKYRQAVHIKNRWVGSWWIGKSPGVDSAAGSHVFRISCWFIGSFDEQSVKTCEQRLFCVAAQPPLACWWLKGKLN